MSPTLASTNALGDLIVEIFRTNGSLLAAGDRLTEGLDLTSARWQVVGAIAVAGRAQTVAQIARNMGLTRQAVQRLANELARDRLVSFVENPDHRKAKLVLLTPGGKTAFRTAMARQGRWARAVQDSAKLNDAQLRRIAAELRGLRLAVEDQYHD